MEILGADFVLYPVTDVGKSVEFYRDVLGLELDFYKEEWYWAEFDAGNVTLVLCGVKDLPESPRGGMIALAVADLDAACGELKSKGVRIERESYELSTCWHLDIFDPDGNKIVIHKRKNGTFGQG